MKGIRKLSNGNIILAINGPEGKKQLEAAPEGWVQMAFNPQANVSKPTYPVAVKGLRTTDLHGATEASILQEMKKGYSSAERVKIWRPKEPIYTRVRVLLAFSELVDAQRAC